MIYKTPKKKKDLVEVRCLGPGTEHTFLSSDRVNERFCKNCRHSNALNYAPPPRVMLGNNAKPIHED